jgi:hypothetical protein
MDSQFDSVIAFADDYIVVGIKIDGAALFASYLNFRIPEPAPAGSSPCRAFLTTLTLD